MVNFSFGIAFGMAIVCLSLFVTGLPHQEQALLDDLDYNNTIKLIKTEISSLKQDFPNQGQESWKIIFSSLKGIVKLKPEKPF